MSLAAQRALEVYQIPIEDEVAQHKAFAIRMQELKHELNNYYARGEQEMIFLALKEKFENNSDEI